jgi:hypothetical protein
VNSGGSAALTFEELEMVLPKTYMPQQSGPQQTQATAVTAKKKKKVTYMQKWATIGGGKSDVTVIQDSEGWVDMSAVVAMKLTCHVRSTSNGATITLQTSNSLDGPWTDVNGTGLTDGTTVLTVSSEGPDETYLGRKYLRWTASGTGNNWQICFYLNYEVLAV